MSTVNKICTVGICLYKYIDKKLYILLCHPGGPHNKDKDKGVWGFVKGKQEHIDDDLFETGLREFKEETDIDLPPIRSKYKYIGNKVYKNKSLHIFCIEGDLPENYVLKSNTCEIEYPKGSGKIIEIPEIDKLEFFDLEKARKYISINQQPFLDIIEKLYGP